MKLQHIITYLTIGIFILLSISCSKEERKTKILKQETAIDNFVKGKYKDSIVIVNGGARRIIIEKGNAEKVLDYGDSVYFYYTGFIFENGPSAIFNTNIEEVASASGLILSEQNFDIFKIRYEKGCMIPGLELGFYGISEHEHSLIVFSAENGYKDEAVTSIPKLSALLYEVWIEKIVKQ